MYDNSFCCVHDFYFADGASLMDKIVINNLEVLNVDWFMSRGCCIGIVLCKDVNTQEFKSYIGTGNGLTPCEDIDCITKWGAKFPVDAAKVLFGVKE